MHINTKSLTSLAFITTLSACGGSSGGERLVFTQGPNAPAYNTATGELSVNGRTVAAVNDRDLARRGNAFVTFSDANSTIAAQTNNGEAYALAYRQDNGALGQPGGAVYGRLTVPELPSTNVTYEGNYAGFAALEEALIFATPITGRATLNVNMNHETVSGGITGRTLEIGNNTSPLADVFLQSASLSDDGRFSGRAVGGRILTDDNGRQGPPATTSGGAFEGALAGETGTTAIGVFRLTHEGSSQDDHPLQERGVFSATR